MTDQRFGDLCNFARCTQEGDHVIVRKHPRTVFTADSAQPAKTGVDQKQRRYRDELGTLTSDRHGTQPARQITIERPGEEDLVLLTNLLDQKTYPVTAILDVYRWRWSIEETFQKVVDIFHLKRLIGSHPLAMIFQASLCLTLYNVMTVLRALLAQTQHCEPEKISMYQVNYDLKRELTTSHMMLTPEECLARLLHHDQTPPQRLAHIMALLKKAWLPRWTKAPPTRNGISPNLNTPKDNPLTSPSIKSSERWRAKMSNAVGVSPTCEPAITLDLSAQTIAHFYNTITGVLE